MSEANVETVRAASELLRASYAAGEADAALLELCAADQREALAAAGLEE